MPDHARGFSLVEVTIATGVAAVLAMIALPPIQGHLTKARRADATAALEQLQFAQERHHALHGLYATDLGALGRANTTRSAEGLYRIDLAVGPGDAYTATARARPDGPQAGDRACAEITLRVDQGFANLGPNNRCWNR